MATVTPVAAYPRLAALALHEIVTFTALYADPGEAVDMIGAVSMVMEDEAHAHEAHEAILHNLAVGLLHQAPCGGLTVTQAGLAAMREGGPYPRHLADGSIIDAC